MLSFQGLIFIVVARVYYIIQKLWDNEINSYLIFTMEALIVMKEIIIENFLIVKSFSRLILLADLKTVRTSEKW